MTNDPSRHPAPMRIEIATSELEGGEYISWADPHQVIACVVAASPLDTFSRFIEPRLSDLDRSPEPPRPGDAARIPARVRTLLDRVRQAHVRLFRENRAAGREPRIARLTMALVEENRVFFVKGTPCWIFRLRQGSAPEAWANEAAAPDAALGSSERLPLAVTSIEVEPRDIVVLLVAQCHQAPDRHAVARAFQETPDLKRACDGLVALLGLQSAGVGAVAMRFVPVGAPAEDGIEGSDVIEDLERELARRLADVPRGPGPPAPAKPASTPAFRSVSDEEIPLPDFLERAGAAPPAGGNAASLGAKGREGSTSLGRLVEEGYRPPPAGGIASSPSQTRTRPWAAWVASLAIVLALLIGVIAIPRGVRLWSGGGVKEASCVLIVEPTPVARAIYVDGVDMRSASPATLEGIMPGTHTVRMDLGAFGLLEQTVRLRGGEKVEIRPVALGSIEVSAAESRDGALAWIAGRPARLVPCRFDSLPVGYHDLFYEDMKVPLFQRRVVIRADETLRVRVPNAIPAGRACLRIESWRMEEGRGLVEAEGDSLFVDGVYRGDAPWEGMLEPGLHGVRVCGSDSVSWTEVVDLSEGCTQVVAPHFGLETWPQILHREPGRVIVRGRLLLTAAIRFEGPEPAVNPRLHVPALGSAGDVPLSAVDGEEGVYFGTVSPSRLPRERPIPYYFTVQTGDGRVISSELYRLTLVSEIS